MKKPRRSLGLVLGVVVLAAACAHRPPSAPSVSGQATGTGHPQWDQFVDGFLEQYYQDHPSYAIQLGRHEFDGRLPDWSATALTDLAARLHAARTQALTFNALTPNARFEREYLIAHLDRELFWLEEAGWPHKNPLYYSDALDPNVYVVRPYAPLADRLKAYVGYAEAIPTAVTQIRHPHSPGRAYYERKLKEEKTPKEALRALKRRISDVVYRRLIDDARRAQR